MGGVRILLAEKWVGAIFDVKCVSDGFMLIKFVAGKSIVSVLSVYALQTGLDDSVKDLFYENLQWTLTKIGASETLFVCDKFCETFTGEMNDTSGEQVVDIWSRLKQGLLSATEKTCGWTKKGIWGKQTWWWNEKVSKDISEKRRL